MRYSSLFVLNRSYVKATVEVKREIFLKDEFLPTVIDLLHCSSVCLRLEALWTLGCAGENEEFKDEILSSQLVDAINQVNFRIYVLYYLWCVFFSSLLFVLY